MELKDHVFLSFFRAPVAGCIQEKAQEQMYKEGDVIFREAEPSDCLCLVLDGHVDIYKRDPSGAEHAIARVGPNDYFGEFGMLDGRPRSAGAVAATNCRIAHLRRADFEECLEDASAPEMLRFSAHSINKFRAANDRYVEERLQRERLSLVGEMASGIIHDFRNPFTVICLAASSLTQKYKDSTTTHFCGLINSQIKRMEIMADELLEFSRGQTHIKKRSFDIGELLDHFENLNREYLANADVDLTVDRIDKQIDADKDKLLRVLQNLANNAVDSFKGSGGHIRIRAEDEGEEVRLQVSDDGMGIPENVQARLFQAFATEGKERGLGLGMAITKSIVDAHGGEITFETEQGKGTTFTITLPSTQSEETS